MSLRTQQFGKWVVLACMGAVAACTSGESATVEGDELRVIFPGGTMGDFELDRVEVNVLCTGVDGNEYFGDDPADETAFTTDLEVVPQADAVNGTLVYHAFMDLLGVCLFQVNAYENGELFCTGGGQTSGPLLEGDYELVDLVISCDVSQNIGTANVDVRLSEDNIIIGVGNFCPFLHSLETIPENIPIEPPEFQLTNPAFDGSWDCQSDANCVGSGPGLGCDNDLTSDTYLKCFPVPNATEFQLCGLDAADVDIANQTISSCGVRCDVDVDPGNLKYTCTATLPDGTASMGTFSDPANGGVGQDLDGDPTTYNGWCSNIAIADLNIALPPSVGYFLCSDQEPGVTVTIECCGGDGDEDCDKCKSHEVTCAGENLCEGKDCSDGNPCTADDCEPATGICSNPADPSANGATCTTNPGFPDAGDGMCDSNGDPASGYCSDVDRCSGVVCDDDPDDCVDGGTCDLADGLCKGGGDLPGGTPCDTTASGPGTCGSNGQSGICVGNCTGVDCSDGNQCTDDVCDPDGNNGSACTPALCCSNPPAVPASCDTCANPPCECDDSDPPMCIDLPPGTCVTGQGTPANDCVVPDFRSVPGNSITASFEKCLILPNPAVSGTMMFDETSTGVFDVTGTQDLNFVIDVTITAFNAQVVITTASVTDFTGTATGALPGTITLDDLGGGFNITADASGNVNCTATNLGTSEDVSDDICPIANLAGGDNSVPLPGDPGERFMPFFTVGNTIFELGDGASATNGYYISNPAPLAGSGSQFVRLAGATTGTAGEYNLDDAVFKVYNSLLDPQTVGFCEGGSNEGASCDFSFPTSDPVCD